MKHQVYLLSGMGDDELVRFASACSTVAISRFPLPLNPPTMAEVRAMMGMGSPTVDKG